MKRFSNFGFFFIAIIGLSASPFTLGQQRPQAKTAPSNGKGATIEGLVRDISCPIQNHKSTATDFNMECALACARQGSPLIILTKGGEMYVPISESMPDTDQRQKLMPFVGKFVKASGAVYELSGTRAIAIKTIAEEKGQHLKTNLQ